MLQLGRINSYLLPLTGWGQERGEREGEREREIEREAKRERERGKEGEREREMLSNKAINFKGKKKLAQRY